LALLTYAYGRLGDHTKTLHAYTKLQQLKNTRLVAPWWLAVAWVGMGNNDKAIEYLTATYRMRSSAFPTIQADPLLDPLRSDPRFQAMLRQASIPSSLNNDVAFAVWLSETQVLGPTFPPGDILAALKTGPARMNEFIQLLRRLINAESH